GHLTGSIDAVLRVRTDDGQARFVVVDYKTNRLSGAHDTPTPLDYGPVQMTEAMVHHHYPLQSLLYSVALHRYLRSRLSDYDPEQHLGGVAYLFVRGMVGQNSPVIDGHTTGVWSWTTPSGLVIELSDLLAGVTVPAKEAS
ncbi:MAG: PD-(D/E)XK nuclease family protein, partial [Microthrixaceae bacterium]|nr:PD-(D/E)XK nuclease family protein [Microthrixaceae bacterium]